MKKLLSVLIIIIIVIGSIAIVHADYKTWEWYLPRWNGSTWYTLASNNSVHYYSEVTDKTYYTTPDTKIVQNAQGIYLRGCAFSLWKGEYYSMCYADPPNHLALSYRTDASPEELGLVTYSLPFKFIYKAWDIVKNAFTGLLSNLKMVLGLDGSIDYDGTTGDLKVSISTGVNFGTEETPI